jgi:transposase
MIRTHILPCGLPRPVADVLNLARRRLYTCPACRFQSHRDVVGQINILSAYGHGAPGKLPVPARRQHRIPHNLRVMRRCRDTGQSSDCRLEKEHAS